MDICCLINTVLFGSFALFIIITLFTFGLGFIGIFFEWITTGKVTWKNQPEVIEKFHDKEEDSDESVKS